MTEKKTVPEMLVEQLVLQELPAEQREEVLGRLRQEEGGMERLQALRASNGEILAAYPADQLAAQIKRRAACVTAPRRFQMPLSWAVPALSTAAACALLLWIATPFGLHGFTASHRAETTQSKAEATRTKGEPRLFVYRKRASGVEELGSMAEVRPKDVLQLRYLSSGARYGVIFSVDGRGSVSLHFPETAEASTALEDGAAHTLPYAYELDDAPGFERFFFVTSSAPIDVKMVLEKGRKLGSDSVRPLVLEKTLGQTSLTLRKVATDPKGEP
jgi:hypothetical protein